eukprot:543055-Rhodomonas_salina.3
MSVRFVSPEETLVLNRDAIFHVLMGSDQRLVCEANKRSAERVAAYTKTDCALQGEEVLQGNALSVKTKPLCEYKAVRLFMSLYDNVLSNWLKTDFNTPLNLVEAFETEYLTGTYRYDALLADEGNDTVVTLGTACRRVDTDKDHFVHDWFKVGRSHHTFNVNGSESLLQGIKRQARKLAHDEVWSVLHDGLESRMALTVLPSRNQVQ